ncbi:hypothetical protein E7T09_08525 [Deinococcus sp. KSM4-11]|uniref:hypothetical protein n=1 Tax=Deinococcus sp. KSM4-11 TaxID=2568654 RepID=UPI0010A32E13|nr:hypothetical protein [Deinococcus sp. KSM4-11]THF87190.1 hypothetical protein E7T09_08525 [Deinococcus sp. KSM4-11]
MTHPPLIDAWVLEADADLIMARYDDTTQTVRAWAAQLGLADGGSFNIQYSGSTAAGAFDAFSVTGEATADQIEQLASRLSRVYDTRIFVSRRQLIAVPHVGMMDGRLTGKYSYFDPEVGERAQRRLEREEKRDLN